jgi:hypothetical protein
VGTLVLIIAVWIAGSFGGAALSYVGGRIMAPEFGLQVPDYGPWFWFWFINLGVLGVVYSFKAMTS